MKNILRSLTLAPLLLGGAAFAQWSPISPKINPLAGLPSILPGPAIVALPTNGIRLPSIVPTLVPTLTLASPSAPSMRLPAAAAPAAFAGAIVIDVPQKIDKVPANNVVGDRENVRHPLNAVLPDRTIRLQARRADDGGRAAPAAAQQEKDDLDAIFDRGQSDGGSPPLSRRGPAGTNHRITTPEDDLERELGL